MWCIESWMQYRHTPGYHGDLTWSNPMCVRACAPAGRDPGWCLAVSSAAWRVYAARPASWFLWAGFPCPGLNLESRESLLACLPVTTETRLGSEQKLFSGGASVPRALSSICSSVFINSRALDDLIGPHTHLVLLLLRVVSLPLHCGEADVEFLDDWGIQAVKVQQQHKLVVETCNEWEREKGSRNMYTNKNDTNTDFWINSDWPTLGSSTRPPA